MADGNFPDVELLRRELAALILEWAGKSVTDDANSPLSTALTRAVSEAARSAVAEQHQSLTAEAADRIAEALERRGKPNGALLGLRRPLGLGVIAVAAVALLAIAFLWGLQTGRKEGSLPPEPAAATAAAAPIAPLAPVQNEPPPASSTPSVATSPPSVRPQRSERAPAKPVARSPVRELGRPAPTSDEASPRSTQPVGAATTTPTSPTPAPPR
jgi:hypothetical protein